MLYLLRSDEGPPGGGPGGRETVEPGGGELTGGGLKERYHKVDYITSRTISTHCVRVPLTPVHLAWGYHWP